MKTTFTVKLGLQGLTYTALVEKGRNHVRTMTGSTIYTTPVPALADITAACNRLDAANQEVLFNGGKNAYDERNLAARKLRALIKELGGYVQAVSEGDKPTIRDGAGFDVVEAGTPLPRPEAPGDLIVRRTAEQGILKLKWKVVYGAKLYFVEMQEEGSTTWEQIISTTKSFHTVENLVTGKRYSFRVQVTTTAGISPMSEVVTNIAA